MAVVTRSSSAALLKAVVLPLALVLLLAVAAGASSEEDGAALAKSGGGLSQTSPAGGRKLLQFIRLCGAGTAPNFNCKAILPFAKNATCCSDIFGNQACWDVGSFWLNKCGSCTTACQYGQVCCSGVCANLLSDKNNCGFCGHKCPGSLRCNFGLCGY